MMIMNYIENTNHKEESFNIGYGINLVQPRIITL